MALLLNIDTATPYASVCISNNNEILAFAESTQQKDHASFLHVAIQSILKTAGVKLNEIDAVAVISGPGSYTGLRVSMASAKGICYALNKPLICINTLEVMAYAALKEMDKAFQPTSYLCPMIDARRMEVFTAVYDTRLKVVLPPCAMVLEPNIFDSFLQKGSILFFGDGAEKAKGIITNLNSYFAEVKHSSTQLAALAVAAFNRKCFADVAYAEPAYCKLFYTIAAKEDPLKP